MLFNFFSVPYPWLHTPRTESWLSAHGVCANHHFSSVTTFVLQRAARNATIAPCVRVSPARSTPPSLFTVLIANQIAFCRPFGSTLYTPGPYMPVLDGLKLVSRIFRANSGLV